MNIIDEAYYKGMIDYNQRTYIYKQYIDSRRYYHGLEHIQTMWDNYKKLRDSFNLLPNKETQLHYAILYHDVEYSCKAAPFENERLSAENFYLHYINNKYYNEDTLIMVKLAIHKTANHFEEPVIDISNPNNDPSVIDTLMFLDIMEMGYDNYVFMKNCKNVIKEYVSFNFPFDEVVQGRNEFFQKIADKQIFLNEEMNKRLHYNIKLYNSFANQSSHSQFESVYGISYV